MKKSDHMFIFKKEHLLNYGLIFGCWLVVIWAITTVFGDGHWFAAWHQWDSKLYQQIFEQGYTDMTLGFPPVYPYLVGFLSYLFGSFHLSGMVLNVTVFFLGLIFSVEVLTKLFQLEKYRSHLFIFSLSAPASYFMFAAYTDFLFYFFLWFLIAIVVLKLSEERRWLAYVSYGLYIVLPLVRITGYAVLSWIVIKKRWALLVLIPLSLWMIINYFITGNPFHFLDAQFLFGVAPGGLLTGLRSTLSLIQPLPPILFDDDWNNWMAIVILPTLFFFLFVGTGLWLLKKKQWLLAITLFSIVFMSFNQSIWRSVVRYMLPLHGLVGVMLLSIVVSKKRIGTLVFYMSTAAFFIIQMYFATVFRVGGWAF